MPFIELATVVVCTTCAGFLFGRSLEEPATASSSDSPPSFDTWADDAAWSNTYGADIQ